MSSESRGLKAINQLIEDLDKYLKSYNLNAMKEKSAFLFDITLELFIRNCEDFNTYTLNNIEHIVKKHGYRLEKYAIYPQGRYFLVYVYIQTW